MSRVIPGLILAWSVSCLVHLAPVALAQPVQKVLSDKEEIAVGQLYVSTEDFPQAIEHFNNALKLDSENGQIYYERGHAYYNLDQFIQAIPDYTRSLQLKYKPSLNYERRAYCFLNARQYIKGIADCSDAIKCDPLSRIAYFNRAKAYGLIGQLDKRKEDLAKIEELDKHPRAKDLYDRARASHDNQERIKLCTAALKIDPNNRQALLLLGTTNVELENQPAAFACFNKMVSLDGNDLTAILNRGLCYSDMGKRAEGEKDLSFVLERAPECYQGYFGLGQNYLAEQNALQTISKNDSKKIQKDADKAKMAQADFTRALKIMQSRMSSEYARKDLHYRKTLGRMLITTYSALSQAFEMQGDLPRAIDQMTLAVNQSRMAPAVLVQLLQKRADLYKKAGRTIEQHEDLKSVKAVSDKIDAIRRGPYIPPPPMSPDKGAPKKQATPTKQQLPD